MKLGGVVKCAYNSFDSIFMRTLPVADQDEVRREMETIVQCIKNNDLTRYGNFKKYQDVLLRIGNGIAAFTSSYPQLDPSEMLKIQEAVLAEEGIDREAVVNFMREVTRKKDEKMREIERFQETAVAPPFKGGMIATLAEGRKK